MPIQEPQNPLPEGPHLGVFTEAGVVRPFPIGSVWLLCEDATKPDKYTPMVLAKVSRKQIIFRCACRRKGCTRVFTYNLAMSGKHIFE